MAYGDIIIKSAHVVIVIGPDAGARQVSVDLTRPVTFLALWIASGYDLTLGHPGFGYHRGESGHHLVHERSKF